MVRVNDIVGAALKYGGAVLMARIVDSAGRCIHPSCIAAVEYSIYRIDVHHPGKRIVVAGHDRVPLEIDELFFSSLQLNDFWSIDVAGFNFRHEIELNHARDALDIGGILEVRYELTPRIGAKTIVRFQLRMTQP